MHLFFSVSVEQCAFSEKTQYGTQRWTPGGNLMTSQSTDHGVTWSTPRVRCSALAFFVLRDVFQRVRPAATS